SASPAGAALSEYRFQLESGFDPSTWKPEVATPQWNPLAPTGVAAAARIVGVTAKARATATRTATTLLGTVGPGTPRALLPMSEAYAQGASHVRVSERSSTVVLAAANTRASTSDATAIRETVVRAMSPVSAKVPVPNCVARLTAP